ncbi:hypothetical protein HAX54_001109 [Datura stramonium]|uniref:Uncharacterized protein n=1 Tax=Datura stramonium TaxID=4076 RepID=A0ABS8RS90_DATST|nr:hypothetical protein [Datura stramonium]
MYFNGVYHLFYQYNQRIHYGATCLGSFESRGLNDWINFRAAIYPSKPFDQFGFVVRFDNYSTRNKQNYLVHGIIEDANKTQVQSMRFLNLSAATAWMGEMGIGIVMGSLRSLGVDNSVVESFGAGGKTCITSRVYPTLAINDKAHLFAFNNGTEPITIETLDAWSMEKAKIDY